MARRRLEAGKRTLYLDCFSGVAGNMLLAALLELGAPAREVRAAIARLGIEGLALRSSRVKRGALAARYVSFRAPPRDGRERRFAAIRRLIERSGLPPRVREQSVAAFAALAQAEGRIHARPPEEVHFHEVGSADAIGDVVGVCAALDLLDVDRVVCSPLPLGRGFVESAHGRLPLPAPATVELLRGVPTYPAELPGGAREGFEMVTPTGAALVATLAESFGPMPAITPAAQGFGAGNDRPGTVPNVLRAVLGERDAGLATDTVAVIETHLDDMRPEAHPYLLDRLLEDGALDAAFSPLSMKKGRPGQLLRVIARPADRDRLARRVLLESSAIGVRISELPRLKLEREIRRVTTGYGVIPVKVVRSPDGQLQAAPEHDACARAARRHAVPLERVWRAAVQVVEGEGS